MSKSEPLTEELPVKLSPEEIELNARALGAAHARRKDVEEVLQEQKTAAKKQLEALDTEIGARSRVAVSGEELRPVPVKYTKDYERGTVTTVRLDTFKVVGSRPMNAEERQQGLFNSIDEPPSVDTRGYSATISHAGKKKPSKEVEDLARDIRAIETKVPGFTDTIVKPILESRSKKAGKQPAAK